jgi:hypothetical protein
MAKTTTMQLRWLRFKRQIRSGPRAAQRRAVPWMALPTFNETTVAASARGAAVVEVLQ